MRLLQLHRIIIIPILWISCSISIYCQNNEAIVDSCAVFIFQLEEGISIDSDSNMTLNQIKTEPIYNEFYQRVFKINKFITETINCELTINQTIALSSLIFNIGIGHFRTSTLYDHLAKNCESNIDLELVKEEFLQWDKTRGINSNTLRMRRLFEFKKFKQK